MSSHNEEPEIYAITRRTPRSIGLGWGGTVLFMIGLISAFFLGRFYFVRIISDVFAIQWCIFTGLFLILGIILWRASRNGALFHLTICVILFVRILQLLNILKNTTLISHLRK